MLHTWIKSRKLHIDSGTCCSFSHYTTLILASWKRVSAKSNSILVEQFNTTYSADSPCALVSAAFVTHSQVVWDTFDSRHYSRWHICVFLYLLQRANSVSKTHCATSSSIQPSMQRACMHTWRDRHRCGHPKLKYMYILHCTEFPPTWHTRLSADCPIVL